MAREVVGVVANVVRPMADVGEGEIDADWICVFSMVMVAELLEPVVQVIWPMVNVRSLATTVESGMMTILLA